jgi:hypothetical protein
VPHEKIMPIKGNQLENENWYRPSAIVLDFLGVDQDIGMGGISSTGRSGRNTRVIMGAWSIHVAEHRWLESYVQRLSVHRHKLTAQRAI